LAFPSAIAQLGIMSMGTIDSIMLGHLDVDALAASALAQTVVWATMSMVGGIVNGAGPLIAHARGRGDFSLARRRMGQAFALALALSPLVAGVWIVSEPILKWFGQNPVLSHRAADYLWFQIPSIFAWLGFQIARDYLMARGVVWRVVVIVAAANLINFAANYALIFGHWGAPALGLNGAGIATTIARFAMFTIVAAQILWVWRKDPPAIVSDENLRRLGWRADGGIRAIVRIGLPVGVITALEAWAFQVASLSAGWFSTQALAAHVIALNLCSLTFMVPLGISSAIATRVGLLLGAGEPESAQKSAYIALAFGGGIMASLGLLLLIFRWQIPAIYGADEEVVALCASIFPIAALFQLFDGLQGVGAGIFRGMGRPRPALIFNMVGYYVLGLPLGWFAAVELGLGVRGIWWGLCLGLAAVATSMCVFIWLRGPARGGHFD
jgi:MATE family multidrug resistance protein